MTKLDQAFEAISALPELQRDEVAEMILDLANALISRDGNSVLTPEQAAELDRRLQTGFQPGDMSRIDEMLARLD